MKETKMAKKKSVKKKITPEPFVEVKPKPKHKASYSPSPLPATPPDVSKEVQESKDKFLKYVNEIVSHYESCELSDPKKSAAVLDVARKFNFLISRIQPK
jgi:hypothetical protein